MNDDKPSAVQALLQDWPLTFVLELTRYSFVIGSGIPTIRFFCSPQKSLLHGIQITADDKAIDNLPVELFVRGDQSTFDNVKGKEPVGYLQFYEPINTNDGVVNDPAAKAEGVVVVSNIAFDNMMALLLHEGGAAILALDVKGLELDSPCGKRWDVSKSSRLDIIDFRFILSDQLVNQREKSEVIAKNESLVRIEELLTELLKQVQEGIRIRIFS